MNLVETYDFAGWTYVNSHWTAHGWDSSTWGDSRIKSNADILAWLQDNIVDNSRFVFASE